MHEIFYQNWMTQIRKGVLELCILSIISTSKIYGYDIIKKLRDVNNLIVAEGTVYPLLNRLKTEKLINTTISKSGEGPPRKYYELTPKGREMLNYMNTHWRQINQSVNILKGEKNEAN